MGIGGVGVRDGEGMGVSDNGGGRKVEGRLRAGGADEGSGWDWGWRSKETDFQWGLTK